VAARGVDIDRHRRHGRRTTGRRSGSVTASRSLTLGRLSTTTAHQQENCGDSENQHRCNDHWLSRASPILQIPV
jgi:hypothetical protein